MAVKKTQKDEQQDNKKIRINRFVDSQKESDVYKPVNDDDSGIVKIDWDNLEEVDDINDLL